VTQFIVEARSTFGQPSLYYIGDDLMAEVDRSKAKRLTEAQAIKRSKIEVARRGRSRRILRIRCATS
jgi:hypothetical protein